MACSSSGADDEDRRRVDDAEGGNGVKSSPERTVERGAIAQRFFLRHGACLPAAAWMPFGGKVEDHNGFGGLAGLGRLERWRFRCCRSGGKIP